MENRSGLLVLLDVKPLCGEGRLAEHEVASDQLDELTLRGFEVRTVGGDRGYHTQDFVRDCRDREIAPHVARVQRRRTPGLDGRHTRSKAYRASQRVRKRIEELFGWMKSVGGLRRTRVRGVERNHHFAQLVGVACNLVRMADEVELFRSELTCKSQSDKILTIMYLRHFVLAGAGAPRQRAGIPMHIISVSSHGRLALPPSLREALGGASHVAARKTATGVHLQPVSVQRSPRGRRGIPPLPAPDVDRTQTK